LTPTEPVVRAGRGTETVVPGALGGERIDRALSTLTGQSRSVVAELISLGAVSVDGQVVKERSRKVKEGQRLSVQELEPGVSESSDAVGGDRVEFEVVEADDHVIVVDKPAGLVVHHGAGHTGGTLVDGLISRFPDLQELSDAGVGDPTRPGIVHRLDKGTSGLMVVARSQQAFLSLSEQLRSKTAGRRYLALVAGKVENDNAIVDAPVGRSTKVATRMAVTPKGKPARTVYKVLERIPGPPEATLIEAVLETGRTHQVRVHMASIGHPVAGDDRYGERWRTSPLMDGSEVGHEPGRVFLHAHELAFDHPTRGRLSFSSPLPEDLESVLEARRRSGQFD
jgi:23S rRNA pseudouridine1911/1915/1917 synthase